MKCICEKACYFRHRKWDAGETLLLTKDEVMPRHFRVYTKEDKKVNKPLNKPISFSELQKKRRGSIESTIDEFLQ